MWDVLLPRSLLYWSLAERIAGKLRGYPWETTSMENCTLSAERRGLKPGFVTRWSPVFPAPAVSFVRGREWVREMLNRSHCWKHPLSGCDAEDYQHVQWTHTTSLSLSFLSKSALNPKLLVKGIKLEGKTQRLTNQITCCLHLATAIKALMTEEDVF